ncbi:MAG: 6-bladed beta-propeller [Candidatus Delongbacteria bacterium]|nr:6-bladed beta-propeller [Candidatus Delongbacteria bacterium]
MKKTMLIVVTLCGIFLLISCSKKNELNYTVTEKEGIKTYRNKNIPADPTLTITPKELFTIQSADENNPDSRVFNKPFAFDVDSKRNIYILDQMSLSVKKFDTKGNFIKSFGRSGNGPGEFRESYCLAILSDTVFVEDGASMRMVKFDTDGNFIANQALIKSTPNYLTPVGIDKFISNNSEVIQESDGVYLGSHLVIMNSKFETLNLYKSTLQKVGTSEVNFLDMNSIFAVGEKEIYMAVNSENEYKIEVVDFNGKALYNIIKQYIKLKFNQNELANLNKELKTSYGSHLKTESAYKKSINQMYVDKNNRLWVISSQNREMLKDDNYYADIFQDGIFLNTIKLDMIKGDDFYNINKQLYFRGEYIYYLDVNNAELKVFEY